MVYDGSLFRVFMLNDLEDEGSMMRLEANMLQCPYIPLVYSKVQEGSKRGFWID